MKDLTNGRISTQIFFFSLPMLLGNIFQQLYNVVDSVVVGNFIGKEALAAVGASFPVIFVLTSFFMGISIGISVIISHYYGARDHNNVKRGIDVMLGFSAIAGVIATLAGSFLTRQIFNLLNTPPNIIEDSIGYFKIYSLGMVFFFGYNGISAILRGLGDSKTPLYFLIVSTVLNIILDLTFVVKFGWGVNGVAIATVISQFVSVASMIVYLQLKHPIMKIRIKAFEFDYQIFKKSINIGLPTGIQQTFVSIGGMALLRIVNQFGSDVAASYAVANRLDSFAMMPAMNFSMALSSFVGQNLGARKVERAIKGLYATIALSAIISTFVTIVFWFFGDKLILIFTRDQEVIVPGLAYLRIVGSCYLFFSTMFCFTGFMRGAGDTFVPMIISIFSLWILRIPAAYLLSRPMFGLGPKGIWLGIPVGWFFGLIASFIYFRMGKWKTRSMKIHVR
ncbi:MAG TPA: MATE family efflux transporter [Candidatus Cloacimonadota bacterium]|jgi:putative MATE family efflux protein|nr:MATE family efflux transporter [Candidatus Cloacimonadales bacterium]HPY97310.1 MATE family efflux transporter [Candidatus Cloacimonadota bacterium]HQB41609.1 MATE family efflux transporter [Candidatus Cloacimonadota bacterium]